MNGRILSVVSMFVASFIIGYNMLPSTQVVQAAEKPVFISPIELVSMTKMNQSVEEIEVEIDLTTQEVSVKGATDAIVNVKMTGEVPHDTVIKYRTIIKEKEVTNGKYPFVKSIARVKQNEKPSSLTEQLNHE